MNVSINWIRDFVDLPQEENHQLAQRFTLATCEVEEVKIINEHLAKVKIVEILKVEKHPEADKLHLVTINTGSEERTIVCGAPNVRAGLKVPFAPIGTNLPGGFTLEPKKIRGILSEGMLCAETELGIGNDDSGLKEFPSNAPIGISLDQYLKLPTDIIFEIDNKSMTNRPDLWCHFGLAREFAAVFKKELKNCFDRDWEESLLKKIPNTPSPVGHRIEAGSACKGYWGLSMKGIRVCSSPDWMQNRLISCGLRPINSIVDISNYVLLELGMPNHIFDRSKIEGNIIVVKKAGENLTMTTLDEQERTILPQDTLICDANRPLALAGIMGGLESSITLETSEIFIECANFIDASIRKTSTRLGLRSDSSLRFEKSLDTHLLKRSILRIMELILLIHPESEVVGSLHYEGEDLSLSPLKITMEIQKISSVLGKSVSNAEILEILSRLDFKTSLQNNLLEIEVPTYRATKDIQGEADIIEEVGRIIGFDNITPIAPKDIIIPTSLSPEKTFTRQLSDFLVYNKRAQELMSYPMIGKALLSRVQWEEKEESLILLNALSSDHDRMRSSIVPSLLESLQLNSRNEIHFTSFELGRVYLPDSKAFSIEENWLGMIFFDKKENRIMDAIDCAEDLLKFFSLSGKVVEQPSSNIFPENWIGLHPHEHLSVQIFGKTEGAILSLHPLLKSHLKIKGHATLLVLRLSNIETKASKKSFHYSPLPKFPGSEFDCTVVLSKEQNAGEALKAVKQLPHKEIKEVKIVDTYDLNESEKTVTLKTRLLNEEKTLDGTFLEEVQNKIISALEKKGFPLKK